MNTTENTFQTDKTGNSPLPKEENIKYNQVGGWLALFCIGLIIIGPLLRMGSIYFGLKALRDLSRYQPELANFICFEILISAILMIFSLYAGFMLWDLRATAVNKAKAFLATNLFIAILNFVVIPFFLLPRELDRKISVYALYDIFLTGISTIIWFSYLTLSKRVRATYE